TDDELTDKEIKQMEADDQAIHIILLGLPKDIYVAVDSCETAQEIWLRIRLFRMQFRIWVWKSKWDYYCFGIANQNKNHNGNGNVVATRAEGNGNGNANNGYQIRCYNCIGLGHYAKNYTVRPRRKDVAYLQTQLLIAQKEEARIQLQGEEFDLMANAGDIDEIEEVNANFILMAILQQASTSGTQTEKAPVYDSDGSAEVSKQKDTTKGTCANTKFANQSTMGKPLFQPLRNHSVVCPPNAFQFERPNFSKTRVPPKVVETNDLANPFTSNSIPTTKESKVVTNDKVIAPGMIRIYPFKTSREDKFVPINKVRASVRTNLIIVSKPHVITKKDVNSDSNGLSSTGVDNTAKTRRPQPRSNTKNDRAPFASKSSCIKNKEVEVKEHEKFDITP
nr:hypothetical protein [Tanacetum cinerariifolium]